MAQRKATPEKLRDDISELVRKNEEMIVAASRRWADSMCDVVPTTQQGLRKLVDDVFDYTETLLKNQRELARSVIDAIVDGEARPRSKRAPSKAKKATRPAPRKPKAA